MKSESKTLATITFQNFFRMYKKLSGMTGTAKTEEDEFNEIYHMDVVEIPTNKPVIRQDFNDRVYISEKGKYDAIIDEIEKVHATGQPILVGTISIENSEKISKSKGRAGWSALFWFRALLPEALSQPGLRSCVAQGGRYFKARAIIADNFSGIAKYIVSFFSLIIISWIKSYSPTSKIGRASCRERV